MLTKRIQKRELFVRKDIKTKTESLKKVEKQVHAQYLITKTAWNKYKEMLDENKQFQTQIDILSETVDMMKTDLHRKK